MLLTYGNVHKESLRSVWNRLYKDSVFTAGPCLMRDSCFRQSKLGLEK
ncbi:radical SAM domain-containing protein [Methanolobus psychrophilus R15]|nr:radical SAM domain-containing protein [Methanolobus psychrophilus R15]